MIEILLIVTSVLMTVFFIIAFTEFKFIKTQVKEIDNLYDILAAVSEGEKEVIDLETAKKLKDRKDKN